MATSTPVLPPDREPCVCSLLRSIARHASALYEENLGGTGLHQPQFGVLSRLDRLGPCSLSELADALDLDLTTTSRNVKLLVGAGLIEVSAGKDARTKAYRLSREGRRRLKAAYPAWQASQAAIRELISAEQRAELTQLARDLATRTGRP
jgi:DNA-binding MarR family transcriptional regulator